MIQTIAAVICEIILQLFIIDRLVGKKKRFAILLPILYSCLCLGISWSIIYSHINPIWSLINYIFFLIYIQLTYQINIKKSFFIFCITAFIISGTELILLFPIKIIFKDFLSEENIQCLLCISTLLLVIFLCSKVKREHIETVLEQDNETIKLLITVCSSIFLYSINNYKIYDFLYLANYLLLLIFLIVVTLLLILWEKEHYERIAQEKERNLCKMYENTYEELIAKIQSRQHEFDNHLAVLKSQFFLCQSYEELKKMTEFYLNELNKDKIEYYNLLKLKNPILAGVLYTKFCKANELGICISYEISVDEIKFSISISKITEVISILLDNAIEKLMELEKQERQLIVFIEEQNELKIEVWNRTEYIDYNVFKKFFQKGYSTKSKERGFGLYNLKNIVSANGGKLSIMNKEKEGKNYICICIELK